MIENNSFNANVSDEIHKTRQISLEQQQLAELQKITSGMQSNAQSNISGMYSSLGSAVNAANMNENLRLQPDMAGRFELPTNMTSISNPYTIASTQPIISTDMLSKASFFGGMALRNGSSIGNAVATSGKDSMDRVADRVNGMLNSPFFAMRTIDYTRQSTKNMEGLQMAKEQSMSRAGMGIANFGSSLAGGELGAMGGAALGTALFPVAGIGTAVGALGGYAVGSMAGKGVMNVFTEQMRDRQGYESWLQQNSDKFISSLESSNVTGAGFNRDERKQMGKFLSNINTDFYMSDDEIGNILEQVTEVGLMKSTTDMESFEKKFKSLVGTVKSGAKMLNTSYEEMIAMLGDLNKEGIKTPEEQNAALAGNKAVSQITGKDTSQSQAMIEGKKASQFSDPSLDPTTSMELSQQSVANADIAKTQLDKMYKDGSLSTIKGGQLLYNTLYSSEFNGDAQKLSQYSSAVSGKVLDNDLTESILSIAMKTDPQSGVTSFDKDMLDEIIKMQGEGKSIGEIANYAQNKYGIDPNLTANNLTTLRNKSGVDTSALLVDQLGEGEAYNLVRNIVSSSAQGQGVSEENIANQQFGLSNDEFYTLTGQAGLYNTPEMQSSSEKFGKSKEQNVFRNQLEESMGASPVDKFKAGFEELFQTGYDGVGSVWNKSIIGSTVRDASREIGAFLSGKDTAWENGYSKYTNDINYAASSKEKTSTDQLYRDIVDSNLYAVDKYQSKNLKDIVYKGEEVDGINYSTNTRGQMVLGLQNSTINRMGESNSTEALLKNIDKNKNLSDEEREKLKSNIAKSEGQTQNSVSSALDAALSIGGRSMRDQVINNTNLTGYGLFTQLDDLTDINKIRKLSLEDQQKIQQAMPDYLVKTIKSNYKTDEELNKVMENKMKDYNEEGMSLYANAMKDNKINDSELKQMVSMIMNRAQGETAGADGESDSSSDMVNTSAQNSKNMGQVAENMKTETEMLDKVLNEQSRKIDMLDKKIAKAGIRS